jgi:3-phosphoshikimate 1-carboxyvinyltransferase
MALLRVQGTAQLGGAVLAPPDKSITHRALILAALGEGEAEISPAGSGADNRATLAALQALGVRATADWEAGVVRVRGAGGPRGLLAPAGPIDCANSGTTMRLLAGVLAASSIRAVLTGDDSLVKRPMGRLWPLIEMGARIDGERRGDQIYPPLTIEGGPLQGRRHQLKIASAQVKSALLLAGLWADGPTTVVEPERSRDHTERMLRALGVPIEVGADGAITVQPIARPWSLARYEIAPDPSSAAFLLAAALLTGSEALEVESSINPTRSGFVDAIQALGAELSIVPCGERGGEPVAKIRVRRRRSMRGGTIDGALTLRAIDEVPILAAVAAFAEGTTTIRDAAELRVKESDRLAGTAKLLTAFGAKVEELEDGLVIHGGAPLSPAEVDGGHDHRMAMTAAVIGLGVPGWTQVRGAEIIDVSFPSFGDELVRLGARLERRED